MLVRGQIVVEGRAVRNESHFAALTAIRRVERSALEKDDALRRIRPSRKTSEQRRFTRSVLPHQESQLARLQGKRDISKHIESSIRERKIPDLQRERRGDVCVGGTECRSFEGKGAPRSTKRLFIELYRRCGTSLLRTGNESATHRPRAALRTRAISVKQAKCAFARRWEVLPRADLRRIARRSKQYQLGKEGSLLSDAGPIADAAETFYSKGFALFPAFGCSSVPRMTQRAGIARLTMHGEDEA